MKKTLLLIVLLCVISSVKLLAQNNSDTTNTPKSAAEIKYEKALKAAADKSRKDSIAAAKAYESKHNSNDPAKIAAAKAKNDSLTAAANAAAKLKYDNDAMLKANKAAADKRKKDSLANVASLKYNADAAAKTAKIAADKRAKDSIANIANLKYNAEAAAKAAKATADKRAKDSITNVANMKNNADASARAAKAAADKRAKDSIANVANMKYNAEGAARAAKATADKRAKDSITAAKVAAKNKPAYSNPVVTPDATAQRRKRDSLLAAQVEANKLNAINDATAQTVRIAAKARQDSLSAAQAANAKQKAANDAAAKVAKKAADKSRKDSIALAKAALRNNKGQSVGGTSPVVAGAPLAVGSAMIAGGPPDTTAKNKKNKQKAPKVKTLSAKELRKIEYKKDPANWTEKQIMAMKFTGFKTDSSQHKNWHGTDTSIANARPFTVFLPKQNVVKFYHRYWRDIDLADPKNKTWLAYNAVFIDVLLAAIKNKEITAYSPVVDSAANPSGDAFTVPVAYDKFMSGLSDTSVVNVLDKDGNITGTKQIPNPFTPDKISGYRIKEDVYYDKARGRYFTTIIGIAPLVKLTLSSGELIGIQPLCWIKFKDVRKEAVRIDIDPTKKIGYSMDDLLVQRAFSSKIVEESNPENLRIKDYKTETADQEVEAKKMEKKIASFKKGSWAYIMNNEPAEDSSTAKPVTKSKKSNSPSKPVSPNQ